MQPSDGVQRVTNSDFSAGAQSWTLQGQTQITPSDRGAGQMARVVAGSTESALLDSAPFDVTGGSPFQLTFSARITASSLGSGYFMLYFLDANGGGPLPIPDPGDGHLTVETIPLAPAHVSVGTTTTDAVGHYQLSITSLGTAQPSLEAAYSGDRQYWPAYAKVEPARAAISRSPITINSPARHGT